MSDENMTDNDKTTLDGAIHEIALKIEHPTYAEVDWCKAGWNAAIRYAEAQHAERVRGLVDALEELKRIHADAGDECPHEANNVISGACPCCGIISDMHGVFTEALAKHRTEDANE